MSPEIFWVVFDELPFENDIFDIPWSDHATGVRHLADGMG